MKRCPECRRDYYDDTLLYCLDDGNALLEGPATGPAGDEPVTAILHETAPPSEAATRGQVTLTEDTSTPISGEQIRVRSKVPFVAAIFVIAGLLAGAVWYLLPRIQPRPGMNMQPSKLLSGLKGTPGNVGISPDGKYVVYSLSENGKTGLWLKQIAQDASIPIVPPAESVAYSGATFSPEGELIYFVTSNRATDRLGSLYSVPILGGKEPRKIKEHVSSRISLSPNGSEFAFLRYFLETGETAVMIAKTDGSAEDRKIASRTGAEWFDSMAWSPDGKSIACGIGTTKGGLSSSIVMVPVSGGEPAVLGTLRFGEIRSIRWLADGNGMLITAPASVTAKSAVWHISYPGGSAERVTKDLNSYSGADISSDGNTAVMSYGDWYSRVWVVGSDGVPKRITNGRDDGLGGVAYLNDGRIVYTVNNNDEQNLWVVNPDGANPKALTTGNTGAWITPYVASPDGRSIVFSSYLPDNVSNTWRVNVDGSGLKRLSTSEDYSPMYFRDGKNILFSRQEGTASLWKMPADGGDAVRVTDTLIANNTAGMSADGKYVACSVTDPTSNPPRKRSGLVDLETGKLLEYIAMPVNAGVANLSPDGKLFVYMEMHEGVVNLWTRPVSGGPARQVTNFNEAFIERFAPAPDGKSFAVTHSEGTNEIVLVKNFR